MRVVTLLFHDVTPEGRGETSGFQGADADVYKLDCSGFQRHLTAIRRILRGQPCTAVELLAGAPPPQPLLLTFDDGGVSAALYIADLLDEFAWKAHFLVTTGLIGAPGFLDRGQIRELRGRGHIVGSHSCSHPVRMSHCSPEELDGEWRRSLLALAEILGEPVQVASVPGGYYSRAVALSAARAGIKLLFTSEPVTRAHTIDGCLVLGRFTAKRGYSPQWSESLVGGRLRPRAREYLFWNAKKIPKLLLGSAWLWMRVRFMHWRRKLAASQSESTGARRRNGGS